MFLKFAGCICIVLASSGFGYCRGLEYQRTVEELEYLRRVIWQLRGEIIYTKAPLAEVCQKVKHRVREPYRTWLEALSAELEDRAAAGMDRLWADLVRQKLASLPLPREDKEELERLGGQLGHLDIRMQERAFEWYAARLEVRQQNLAGKLEERRRLCSCLGVMGGMFLSILLL